jgi:hypothetical protein
VKHPNLLLRTAVVLCSALLISGFVSYRAGAFDRLLGRNPPPPAAVEETPAGEGSLFYSSKVGKIFVAPDPSQQPSPAGTQPALDLLPGSKRLTPLIPQPAPSTPAPPPPASAPSSPTP